MEEKEKAIVKALQGDFPLTAEPYKILAAKAGMTEAEFIAGIKRMRSDGLIRKMGAVLRHREVGFRANALCAWEVRAEKLEEIALAMSRHPALTHCYDRSTAPGWPYNLYTMIHGESREECESIAAELERENQPHIKQRIMLYSKKEWKKTSMEYFNEER